MEERSPDNDEMREQDSSSSGIKTILVLVERASQLN
jgi:hypothetical protein